MCPEHDFTLFDDERQDGSVDLTFSVTRAAKYSDMVYQGEHEIYTYKGNVIVVPIGLKANDDTYEFKHAEIFVDSNGVLKKNRFGRMA
jgi:hypothetical protein